MVQQERPVHPKKFTFYLRPQAATKKLPSVDENLLRAIDITLISRDLHTTVHHILTSCQLSTSYLDTIPKEKPRKRTSFQEIHWRDPFSTSKTTNRHDINIDDVEEALAHRPVETLRSWLHKNATNARNKLEATRLIREETEKLQGELRSRLGLTDILWSCGWGIAHFKGCLQSLNALRQHHPDVMENLRGRTVVFGSLTGVSLDGHIILSSSDVRNSWLDLIRRVKEHDVTLQRIPAVEKTVSRVLHDIRVVHRKFQPAVTAQNYESQLRTLSARITDFWVKNGYPSSWNESLENFQLVVECEAGPLMLSPTGQYIVPSSCPAFLMVNFITDNLGEANRRLETYKHSKLKEEELHRQCVSILRLSDLQKDDNVTPDRMIECCHNLLKHQDLLVPHLEGARINITHFYSVLHDGEMCLPWNWEF